MIGKKVKNFINTNLFSLMGMYPPYLGAGIKSKKLDDLGFKVEVTMKMTSYNKNYVGTHFGGSLYSMCDPFYMLMLLQHIGKEYLVWDKSASIKFVSPGRGTVKALFEISQEMIDEIKLKVEQEGVYEPTFSVEVKDSNDKVVAVIDKKLWVKKKS